MSLCENPAELARPPVESTRFIVRLCKVRLSARSAVASPEPGGGGGKLSGLGLGARRGGPVGAPGSGGFLRASRFASLCDGTPLAPR
mmetsp:Transcript_100213/g.283758  ORF Transcript_100213/g.283758 Transcript_100213/m.283758 type:complete len:87 (+) Transcript_100213:855-1115(+)